MERGFGRWSGIVLALNIPTRKVNDAEHHPSLDSGTDVLNWTDKKASLNWANVLAFSKMFGSMYSCSSMKRVFCSVLIESKKVT